jgi:hypothetical protein
LRRLLTIVGDLLDNAIDAAAGGPPPAAAGRCGFRWWKPSIR